ETLTLDHGANVKALTFSPTGGLIATVGGDHTARLWELPSGVPHADYVSQVGSDEALAFAADGGTLAVAGHDRAFAVSLWDLSTAQRESRLSDSGSAGARARVSPAARVYTD